MKKHIIYSLIIAAGASLSGCLEEFTPTNQATADQIKGEDKGSLSSAVSAYMTSFTSYGDGGLSNDAGFPGFGIHRDAMTADIPAYTTTYDYFTDFSYTNYLGNYSLQTLFWRRYYYLIQKCNLVMSVAQPEERTEDREYAGNALAYRAMAYFDMARLYEYRHTDVASLDQQAEASGIMGLTVPIVTEATTDASGRDNPRAPFYTMYRSVLGTRFLLHPADLDTQLSHDSDEDIVYNKLGIASANDCFNNAAAYARKAISEGYAPLSESQWFDPKTGFNTPNAAWMWCVTLTLDNPAVNLEWQSFVSFVSPEATWGIADAGYGASRMIDARLFDKIPDSDWRKTTWIDPKTLVTSRHITPNMQKAHLWATTNGVNMADMSASSTIPEAATVPLMLWAML